ncbi:coiled-coil domain-containing protein 89-like, partial [Clytia hemisphaerica]|uniref:coiled-coil domain-containing protein 89-like n=1 Tax=Clytia hemisphaerica TaxID=252671 RepID=UPI0034D418AA
YIQVGITHQSISCYLGKLKKGGRPSLKQKLEEEQTKNLQNPKRKCVTSYFQSLNGRSIPKPVSSHPTSQSTHEQSTHEQSTHEQSTHEQSTHEKSIHEQSTHEQSTHEQSTHEQSTHEQSQLSQDKESLFKGEIKTLRKENLDLRFEVLHLKRSEKEEVESLQAQILKLEEKLKGLADSDRYVREQLEKQKTQLDNVMKHDLVRDLLVALSAKEHSLNNMRKAIIKSMLSNSTSGRKSFSVLEQDFWLDMYHNCSHRVFNRISETLNGPWRSTVEIWGGPTERNSFNLSWRTVERSCRFMLEKENMMTIRDIDPILKSHSIP